MEARGHSITKTSSSLRAVQVLRSGPGVDLIIQDLHRPSENFGIEQAGWELIRDVLDPEFPEIPVVIFSANVVAEGNKSLAEFWNVTIFSKVGGTQRMEEIASHVSEVLESQRKVLRQSDLGFARLLLDFDIVNSQLVQHLARNSLDIYKVGWKAFQDLVATLLTELGYDVERRPYTHDEGVDMWALQKSSLGETLYAIDAKKQRPDRPVGPVPVRAIHGVVDMKKATVGMIVTTSRFSPAAKDLESEFRFRLSLKDFDDVCAWIAAVAAG